MLFKEAEVFCIFNMHQINHCLWLAILASTRDPTTRVTFTLVSFKVCFLQVLCAYIINRNNFWDDLVTRPAAERHAYSPAMPAQYEVTRVFKRS